MAKLTLSFRDRWNKQHTIRITEIERDALKSAGAIKRQPFRSHAYSLFGHGAEFYRDVSGLLMSQPFVYEPARLPPRELTAIERLFALGLHWEALTLAMRNNAAILLHRAPCKSGTFLLTEARPVLFSPV